MAASRILTTKEVAGMIRYYKSAKDFRADLERYEPLLVEMWGKDKYFDFVEDMRGHYGTQVSPKYGRADEGRLFKFGNVSRLRFVLEENIYYKDEDKKKFIKVLHSSGVKGTVQNPWKHFYREGGDNGYSLKTRPKDELREYIFSQLRPQYATVKDFQADIERYREPLTKLLGKEEFRNLARAAGQVPNTKVSSPKNITTSATSSLYGFLVNQDYNNKKHLDEQRKKEVGTGSPNSIPWSLYREWGDYGEVVSTKEMDDIEATLANDRREDFLAFKPLTDAIVEGFAGGVIGKHRVEPFKSDRPTNASLEGVRGVSDFAGAVTRDITVSMGIGGAVRGIAAATLGKIPHVQKLLQAANSTRKGTLITKALGNIGTDTATGLIKASTFDNIINPEGRSAKDIFKAGLEWGGGQVGREVTTAILGNIAPGLSKGLVNLAGFIADTTAGTATLLPFSNEEERKELLNHLVSPEIVAMGLVSALQFAMVNGDVKDDLLSFGEELDTIDSLLKAYDTTGHAEYINKAYAQLDNMWNSYMPKDIVNNVGAKGDFFVAKLKDNISNRMYEPIDAELVKSTQKVLAGLGYDTPIDGVRSVRFNNALAGFQAQMGMEQSPDLVFTDFNQHLQTARQMKKAGVWKPQAGITTPLIETKDWPTNTAPVYDYHGQRYNRMMDLEEAKRAREDALFQGTDEEVAELDERIRDLEINTSYKLDIFSDGEQQDISKPSTGIASEGGKLPASPNTSESLLAGRGEDPRVMQLHNLQILREQAKLEGLAEVESFLDAQISHTSMLINGDPPIVKQPDTLEEPSPFDTESFKINVDDMLSLYRERSDYLMDEDYDSALDMSGRIDTLKESFDLEDPNVQSIISLIEKETSEQTRSLLRNDSFEIPDNTTAVELNKAITKFVKQKDAEYRKGQKDYMRMLTAEQKKQHREYENTRNKANPTDIGKGHTAGGTDGTTQPEGGNTPPENIPTRGNVPLEDAPLEPPTMPEMPEFVPLTNTGEETSGSIERPHGDARFQPDPETKRELEAFVRNANKDLSAEEIYKLRNTNTPRKGSAINTTRFDATNQFLWALDKTASALNKTTRSLADTAQGAKDLLGDATGREAAQAMLDRQGSLGATLGNLAEYQTAMRNVLFYYGNQLIDQAHYIKQHPDSIRSNPKALAQFGADVSTFNLLVKANVNNAGEIARSLSAYRIRVGDTFSGNPSVPSAFDVASPELDTAIKRIYDDSGGEDGLIKTAEKIVELGSPEAVLDYMKGKGKKEVKDKPLEKAFLELRINNLLSFASGIRNEISQFVNEHIAVFIDKPLEYAVGKTLDPIRRAKGQPTSDMSWEEVTAAIGGSLRGFWEGILHPVFPSTVALSPDKINKVLKGNEDFKVPTMLDVFGNILHDPKKAASDLEDMLFAARGQGRKDRVSAEVGETLQKVDDKGRKLSSTNLRDTSLGRAVDKILDVIAAPFSGKTSEDTAEDISVDTDVDEETQQQEAADFLTRQNELRLRNDPAHTPLSNYLWYFTDIAGSLIRLSGYGMLDVGDRKYANAAYLSKLEESLVAYRNSLPKDENDLQGLTSVDGQKINDLVSSYRDYVLAYNAILQVEPLIDAYALAEATTEVEKRVEKMNKLTGEIEVVKEKVPQVDKDKVIKIKKDSLDALTDGIYTKMVAEDSKVDLQKVKEIHELCQLQADDRTFKTELYGKTFRGFEKFMNDNPLLKGVSTVYLHTPLKLAEEANYHSTGLGLLTSAKLRDDLRSPDARTKNKALAAQVTGAILFLLGSYLVRTGQVTPSASDPAERRRMREAGIPEHSIKIAGVWIDYSSLDPYVGHFLALAAGLDKAIFYAPDDATVLEKVSVGVNAYAVASLDKTWYQGVKELFNLFTGIGQGQFVGDILNSLVPSAGNRRLFNQGGLIGDPVLDLLRETEGAIDGFNKSSYKIYKLDTYGKPLTANRHILGFRYNLPKDKINSPIRHELVRLRRSLAPQTNTPAGIDEPLDPRMYYQLARSLDVREGDPNYVSAEDRLNELVTSDYYKDLGDAEEQRNEIGKLWTALKKENITYFASVSEEFAELVNQAYIRRNTERTEGEGYKREQAPWMSTFDPKEGL